MTFAQSKKLMGALALTAGVTLGGCSQSLQDNNTSLHSVKQPVVERTNYTIDVATTGTGLTIAEQQRLNGWFETMDLRYGDRITVDNPTGNPAVTNAVNDLAGRYGLIVDGVAPTTPGTLAPGQARVVITRADAYVPDCPDWSDKFDGNYKNATSPGYGCAINGNLAAMVANPEDLLEGQTGSGETVVATGNKAIQTFRETAPTGAGGLGAAQAGGGN
jgi:pilus assembly protein CpaD